MSLLRAEKAHAFEICFWWCFDCSPHSRQKWCAKEAPPFTKMKIIFFWPYAVPLNLPGWCWARIMQLALIGSSSSLHSEACKALGGSDGVVHSTISLAAICIRAVAKVNCTTLSAGVRHGCLFQAAWLQDLPGSHVQRHIQMPVLAGCVEHCCLHVFCEPFWG